MKQLTLQQQIAAEFKRGNYNQALIAQHLNKTASWITNCISRDADLRTAYDAHRTREQVRIRKRNEAILEAYKNGTDIHDIAREHGLAHATVRILLSDMNVYIPKPKAELKGEYFPLGRMWYGVGY